MDDLLIDKRAELIDRCKARVAARLPRAATRERLESGIPQFLERLTLAIKEEARCQTDGTPRSSGSAEGAVRASSEFGFSAAIHAKQLLDLGYTVEDIIHGYGDVCASCSDMAANRDGPPRAEGFKTLHRCVDLAMAEAVASFITERDSVAARRYLDESNERLGFLLHELRNALQTAALAVTALERGELPIAGATGGVLKRSLVTLTSLVKHSLDEVRGAASVAGNRAFFSLSSFIADAGNAALLGAEMRESSFVVKSDIGPEIAVYGDRELLLGALLNLVQNAFKFTQSGTEVSLSARSGNDGAVCIDVADHCGGLAPGVEEAMFRPFAQHHKDRSGLGLGLSIAKQNVQKAGGSLTVRDVPGTGCIFTIALRQHEHMA